MNEIIEKITSGNRRAVSRAISLVEDVLPVLQVPESQPSLIN